MEIDCIEWIGDHPIQLDNLLWLIGNLQYKYGKKAVVRFNAGANNVQVMITPSKKGASRASQVQERE